MKEEQNKAKKIDYGPGKQGNIGGSSTTT